MTGLSSVVAENRDTFFPFKLPFEIDFTEKFASVSIDWRPKLM